MKNIDVHYHIAGGYRDRDGKNSLINTAITNMINNQTTTVVIFPLNPRDPEKITLVNHELAILANDENLKHDFKYFYRPSQMDANTAEIIEKEILENNCSGIKLHPEAQRFSLLSEHCKKVIRLAGHYNVPVIIHTSLNFECPYAHPMEAIKLAEQFPQTNIILGHFARLCPDNRKFILNLRNFQKEEIISKIRDLDNLYIETSFNSTPQGIEEIGNKIGFQKILFGSDYPYADPTKEKQKILQANIKQSQKELILFKNAQRLGLADAQGGWVLRQYQENPEELWKYIVKIKKQIVDEFWS